MLSPSEVRRRGSIFLCLEQVHTCSGHANRSGWEEIYFIFNTKRSEEAPLMTTMIKNHIPVQVPAGAGKKTRIAKKKPAAKGFFGLLPDWNIDTQAFRDELRD